ncbi:P-loop containing nucleoside triphosphate hydrolase protein [Mycena amicta]|nr:P-loop containing nucleoside triphosphate hydrolase protein [Mycena amicta]
MRPLTPPAALVEPDAELVALMNDPDAEPLFVVVMGVSGTGKSTMGAALARAIGLPYVDGDDLHPKSNVDKMARGEPLTDDDRGPWLRKIRSTAESMVDVGDRRGVVIACSALRRVYRDVLRGNNTKLKTHFVFIEGSRGVLLERMEKRSAHFMKANMLDSQLATLEHPGGEDGVLVVSVDDGTVLQVKKAVAWIKSGFVEIR